MNKTMKTQPKSRFLARLERVIGAGAAATAAATGAGIVGTSHEAEATLVHSGTVNIPIPVNVDGVYLNLVTGATGTSGSSTPGWDINPFSGTSLSWFTPSTPTASHGLVRGIGSSTTLVDNLPTGTLIDATNPLPSPNYGTGGNETTGSTAFVFNGTNCVGLRFFNESTQSINYAWMRIGLGASFIDPARTIVDYAYDNMGVGVACGVIPEPSALALLAVGASALTIRRRRSAK